ncbi:MAG: glycoside hydrolase family 28 protein [Acidobacteriia bacterium]|nr:glycoside hydrolase family 28 protein [Terriglobia bacterium]
MRITALALLPLVAAAVQGANFDVKAYGARGDGAALDTAAIQKAIDAASAGRGTVVVGPGVYRTGALFLKSGVELRIGKGATLLGSQEIADYPMKPTRVAGIEMTWPSALLNVYEQSDVKITGEGQVDGDGKKWWDLYWKMRREEYEPKGIRWAVDYDCRRPRLIQVYQSSNVELKGLNLKRPGFWTVHLCYSQNVVVDGLTIRNNSDGRGPSTDGIDIDSSSDVTVTHCSIECNDDAICLKAGRDADGLRVNRPTRNIVIRDNTVAAGAAGVTIGSETSGGIRDIEVDGLKVLAGVPAGILFKSASTRGGTVENISIRNVEMTGVATPLSITMDWNPAYSYAKIPAGMTGYPDYWRVLTEPVPPEKGLPHFRNVRIANVEATGAARAFRVSSHAGAPLVDFQLDGLDIDARAAGEIANAERWKFTNLKLRTADGSRVALRDSREVEGLEAVNP